MFKAGGRVLAGLLLKLFSFVNESEQVPSEWMKANMANLHKAGDASDPQQLPWNITYQLPGQDLPLYLGRALYASHGIATFSVAGGTRSRSITLTAAPP